jgi:uncharacterized heparinase superfamily protein
MLNLKSAYFYFLAIKINLIKIIKKIYFTTEFYNKSLKSKIPQQFYFFPNPFLLSSITSYKNFSLQITQLNLNNFWNKKISQFEEERINSFLWLNLIDRKNESLIIQKIITLWINKHSKYKKVIWENPIISRRVISWILNADIILDNTDVHFKQIFLQSIIIQTNHLKKNIKFEKNNSKKIEILAAIILSGLVFKEYQENFDSGLKELEILVEDFFDKDGFPLSRNPNHLLKFSKYFILIKECIKDAHQYVPDFLDEIIQKNLNCIKYMTTPENKMPLFNGGTEIDMGDFYRYIDNLNYKTNLVKSIIGGIHILKYKKDIVFLDVGDPPKKSYSKSYQSGPVSFEYYVDGDKIITNCGFGYNISNKAMLLSRLTSAQSTLSINDTSTVKFERNKFINKAFGNSIKNSFKVNGAIIDDNEFEIKTDVTHNAYENNYGYAHKREVKIDKKTKNLIGVDHLINIKSQKIIKYDLRFHLYPGISAVQTMDGNNILIRLNKNKSLIFASKNQQLSVEKSIFLGGNKILNNLCITITGNLVNKNNKIHWEIRKNI